jgi:outer membrane immunogenic protein
MQVALGIPVNEELKAGLHKPDLFYLKSVSSFRDKPSQLAGNFPHIVKLRTDAILQRLRRIHFTVRYCSTRIVLRCLWTRGGEGNLRRTDADFILNAESSLESNMRRSKLIYSAAIAMSAAFGIASASAADMPARAYSKAPPPMVAAPSWTGFYVFGGGGYGMWNADTTTVSPVTGICVLCTNERQGGSGYFGTVGAGYDYQFGGSWVAGVFADGQFGSIKGTIGDQGPFFTGQEKLRTSYAAGVRVGYLVAPNVYSYINGGYSGSQWSGANMVTTFNGAATAFSTPSFHRDGWFLGGSVENSLGFFSPNLFMKTEYRYAEYGRTTLPDTSLAGAAANSITFKPWVQTVSTALAYRFNWSGPIAARY